MQNKTLITSALLALGLISQASADVVYLTGSTAFRGTVATALATPGLVFDGTPTIATRGNTTYTKAPYVLFHGTVGGVDTYVDCAWSGSEAGIASASDLTIDNAPYGTLAGSPEVWLKADGTVTGLSASAPTTAELENNGVASHGADLAQADTSQAVSLTPRVPNTQTDLYDYGVEGIVTFTYAKNINSTPSSSWTDLVNVNTGLINLLTTGPQLASQFTGNVADNQHVYLVGRNKGSGTRANFMSDIGLATTTSINQFSIGGGVSTPTTGTLTLASEGNNGYEGGGNVAAAMKIDGSCQQTDPFFGGTGWLAVAYLGVSDAAGLPFLTENGVMMSDGAIEEGQYSFWGHEHLYGKYGIHATANTADTVGTKLEAGVAATLGTAGSNPAAQDPGIAISYMHVDKLTDTVYPTHL